MTVILTAFEWRYVPGGAVKHALTNVYDRHGVCGIGPHWSVTDWYGTGSQVEYETVETLPPCKRCLRRLGQ